MTTADILRMAREAGFHAGTVFMTGHEPLHFVEPMTANSFAALERFFRLAYAAGAAAERDGCAKVAKAISDKYAFGHYGNEVDTADEIAAAIRARGKT